VSSSSSAEQTSKPNITVHIFFSTRCHILDLVFRRVQLAVEVFPPDNLPALEIRLMPVGPHGVRMSRVGDQRPTEVDVVGNGLRRTVLRQQRMRQGEVSVADPPESGADGGRAQLKADFVNQFHQIRACLVRRMDLCTNK